MMNNILLEDILPQYNGEFVNAPGENPYELLKGYIDPENKVQFAITYKGRTSKGETSNKTYCSIKLVDAKFDNGGYIVLVGTSSGQTVEASIMKNHFLGVMTGAMAPLHSLVVNGKEIERFFDEKYKVKDTDSNDSQYRNYYILLKSFDSKQLKSKQTTLKNELMQVYEGLNELSKNYITHGLLGKWYKDEVKREKAKDEANKKRIKQGKSVPDKSNNLSQFYTSVHAMLEKLPGAKLYSVGNSKVSRDTLLVNITAAVDCPSLGHKDFDSGELEGATCLVGDACYAQASEIQYANTRFRNRLLQLINTICLRGNRMDLIKNIIKDYITSARDAGFNIRSIRLNENGDFIDQNCINQYSKICGEIRDETGVLSTAYTVKTHNYQGPLDYSATRSDKPGTPPNIVLTVSRFNDKGIGTRFNPSKGEIENSAINLADRYFLAIQPEVFHALPDTPIVEKGQPNLATNPAFKSDMVPDGAFHKCQCEIDKGKVCGDCQVCYTPNLTGRKYYVFCKLHGPAAEHASITALEKNRGFGVNSKNLSDINSIDNSLTTQPANEPREYTQDIDNEFRQNAKFGDDNSDNWFQRQRTPKPEPKRKRKAKKQTNNTQPEIPYKEVSESMVRRIVRDMLTEMVSTGNNDKFCN